MDDKVPMREYIESLLNERVRAHEREHELLERSVKDTKDNLDSRLESMNLFREQLREQAATFARADTIQGKIDAMAERMEKLEGALLSRIEANANESNRRLTVLERAGANLEGRMWALGVGITLVVVVVNIVLRFIQ